MLIAQDGPGRAARLGELHRSLLADVPRMREVQFRIGRTLLEIRRLEDFTSLGSTTYAMYCESSGLSPVEGREYLAMVQATAVLPEVETKVLEGKITPQKATVIHDQRQGLRDRGNERGTSGEKRDARSEGSPCP